MQKHILTLYIITHNEQETMVQLRSPTIFWRHLKLLKWHDHHKAPAHYTYLRKKGQVNFKSKRTMRQYPSNPLPIQGGWRLTTQEPLV